MKSILRYLIPFVLLVAAFAAGVFVGRFQGQHELAVPPKRAVFVDRMVKRMTRSLELTEAQQQKIAGILHQQEERLREIKRQSLPRLMAIHEESRIRIREELTETQAKAFDRLAEKRRKGPPKHRRGKGRHRHEPPPPPPLPDAEGGRSEM